MVAIERHITNLNISIQSAIRLNDEHQLKFQAAELQHRAQLEASLKVQFEELTHKHQADLDRVQHEGMTLHKTHFGMFVIGHCTTKLWL